MNSGFVEAPVNPAAHLGPNLAGAAEDLAGLEPVKTLQSRWPMVIAGVLTAAMIVGLVHQLLKSGLAGLSHATPGNPLYYLFFVLLYLSPPIGDYIIFRKLWRIPLEGLGALMKKRIANEVVLGYSGEAYFYAWARQRAQMVAAPFGAVKDVMILSAMAGNVMTLAMTALAMSSLPPEYERPMLVGMGVVVAMCLPFLFFSRRVFSLDRSSLWWVFGVHMVRLAVGSVAIAFAWHFAMPSVAIGTWLTLSATRMMVSRLPFLPSKDTVFATVAIGLLGAHNDSLKSLMAFTAALILLVHVVLAAGFAVQSLIKRQV
ncbi:hypothetical protein [Sphingomonas sp.]|uniref:hypothetical protein n=1 Tax=Sphingomonas sp. TaxID=28214 RepID=UPI002E31259A|nr:hypothetical protein [Sphingomonas sp.]HEX4694253.1 hypothetical protein [Sphingomonas sp.]